MEVRNGNELLSLMRGYQIPCVLAAAVDLGVFEALADSPLAGEQLADRISCPPRATTILLDAMTSVGLLLKKDSMYSVPPLLAPLTKESTEQSVFAMLRHQANCLRRWSRLPWVVRSGKAVTDEPSIRGGAADQAAFVEAMNVVTRDAAEEIVREVCPGRFRCLLDVGGASGTWTLAWLNMEPAARAILFDLPHVIPMARQRLDDEGMHSVVRARNTEPSKNSKNIIV